MHNSRLEFTFLCHLPTYYIFYIVFQAKAKKSRPTKLGDPKGEVRVGPNLDSRLTSSMITAWKMPIISAIMCKTS